MSKHTAGPWFAKHDDGKYHNLDNWKSPEHEMHAYSSAAPVVDSKGKLVAYVCGATSSSKGFAAIDEIIEPRAQLIAAAPELLEALKSIVQSLADQDDEGMIEHVQPMINARAAIAKATGESNG